VDHADHVRLLRKGVLSGVIGVWADLGAGTGAFTLALADLLATGSTIHAIDREGGGLVELERRYARFARKRSGAPTLVPRIADFTDDLGLEDLDGVVMANSLHFTRHKEPVLAHVRGMLRSGASLLLVEYDADRGNQWVPYPISFETWRSLAVRSGFKEPALLDSEPSRFMNRIYSASATKLDAGA